MIRDSAPVLAFAVLALLGMVAGCSHAGSRPTLPQREAACAPVWQKVHAELDASSACTADWECRAVRPEYLGCDAWANLDYRLSEGRLVELENACAPVSLARKCDEQVGACMAGRCAGRPPIRDPAACVRAKSQLEQRLALPTVCHADAECAVVIVNGPRGIGPAEWKTVLAREVAAISDSCEATDVNRPLDGGPIPSCRDHVCVARAPDGGATPWTKPRAVAPGCVARSVRLPLDKRVQLDTVIASFLVSKRGVPYAFAFQGTDDTAVWFALADAISSCAFEPGKNGAEAVEIRLVLPIRFR
jgi:hypothetical protein